MQSFDIMDFGAVGDGRTLNTRAIQAAALACQKAGGGVVRVPAGTFLTGIFELFSNTTLRVEKDGRLLGSPDLNDHVVDGASVGLLYAQNARDIVLTGEGVLDGNAPTFFDPGFLHNASEDWSGNDTWQKRHGLPYGTKERAFGPFGSRGRPGNMIVFVQCHNIRIEKLTITGSAYWTIHCADCEDVTVEKIRIDNDLRHPNNDGVHFSTCRRVKVRDCWISCADDCVAITGFLDGGSDRQIAFGLRGLVGVGGDIEISDCVMTSRSSAVRIGYGLNPTRGVRLSRLKITSNRGIGIFAPEAEVEDVVVEDCQIETRLFHGDWWGRGEPIQLTAVRFPGNPKLFPIRHVAFRRIEATGENGIVLFAEEPGAIEDVEMTQVKMTARYSELFENWGGNLDLRPAANPKLGITVGGDAPLFAIGVSGLRCTDCSWNVDEPARKHFSAQPVKRERY